MKNISNDAFMTYTKKPFFKGEAALKVISSTELKNIKGNLCTRAKNTFAEINGELCKVSDLNVKALYETGSMKK